MITRIVSFRAVARKDTMLCFSIFMIKYDMIFKKMDFLFNLLFNLDF